MAPPKEKKMGNAQGNDTKDEKIMKKIEELLNIPGVKEHLSEQLSNILEQVNQQFKAKIDHYMSSKKLDKKVLFKKNTDEYLKGWTKGKTYFFDLNGVKDRNGIKWELVRGKSTVEGNIVDMILLEFIKKIDKYEASPDLLRAEIIEYPALERAFKIGFTRKSETRVMGFIKELEERIGLEDFTIKDDEHILMITKRYKNLEKEEMYMKIKQLMKDHPELIEDIFFYSFMVLKYNQIL